MPTDGERRLERRVYQAAEQALAEQKFVTAVDVLSGIGWLNANVVAEWRQGRVDYLERVITVDISKISTAMRIFRRWALDRGLTPSETAYVARTRDRRSLRFSQFGRPEVERSYRTHWVSPELSLEEKRRIAEKQSRPPELVVISSLNDWTCGRCGAEKARGQLLLMEANAPICLACAGMEHLAFLSSGNAKLTRRASSYSESSAVVVRFSRARKRYERQGVLIEPGALERAEDECLSQEEIQQRRQLRGASLRGETRAGDRD